MIHNTKISIIAAIGKNRELGKDNRLLWRIPEDLKRFKEKTRGHAIIMGRKTWESLPTKPLPNRTNIIITRDSSFIPAMAGLAGSLEEAIEIAKKVILGRSEATTPESDSGQARMTKEIFIVGGGQIFAEALNKKLVDKLYLTIIDEEKDADTFFPDYSEFKKVIFEESHKSGGHKYKFLDLER